MRAPRPSSGERAPDASKIFRADDGSVQANVSVFLPNVGEVGCGGKPRGRSVAHQTGGGVRAARHCPLRLASLGTSPTMGEENKVCMRLRCAVLESA